MVKVLFIPKYLSTVLKESETPLELLLEEWKKFNTSNKLKNSMDIIDSNDVVDDSGYLTTLDKIKCTIGSHDFNTLVNTNYCMSGTLFGDIYNDASYQAFNASSYTEDNYREVNNTIYNSLLTKNPPSFNETYDIYLKNDDVVIVELKEGFTNYIFVGGNQENKKVLLSEIINLFKKDKVMDSFLSQVYLRLS